MQVASPVGTLFRDYDAEVIGLGPGDAQFLM